MSNVSAIARLVGKRIRLPGIASTHSHAFQRALRGRTQRSQGRGSFWSWRALMYQHAASLDPESIYSVSYAAYEELRAHGVRAVGEFHYVHHQPDGTPYSDRTILADAVVRAAHDAGLRICLLRVLYERGGHQQQLDPVQRRFCDGRVEDALRDVETLQSHYAKSPGVRIGLAPHSVRAVSEAWLREANAFATDRDLPIHMHVSEQLRELEECKLEHQGRTPVQVLSDLGVLSERFVAVHATHLTPGEAELLGQARAFACICRTTERDLGDGLPDIGTLRDAGARFCMGTDSHAMSCPFEEARAVELDERSRTLSRHAGLDASALLRASTHDGYRAIGFSAEDAEQDEIFLDARDLALRGFDVELLDEAVVYGAGRSAIIP